ncbi:hypothetical protein ACVWZZ_003317 [Bradyrhizobium sp. LM6.10]
MDPKTRSLDDNIRPSPLDQFLMTHHVASALDQSDQDVESTAAHRQRLAIFHQQSLGDDQAKRTELKHFGVVVCSRLQRRYLTFQVICPNPDHRVHPGGVEHDDQKHAEATIPAADWPPLRKWETLAAVILEHRVFLRKVNVNCVTEYVAKVRAERSMGRVQPTFRQCQLPLYWLHHVKLQQFI